MIRIAVLLILIGSCVAAIASLINYITAKQADKDARSQLVATWVGVAMICLLVLK